ncbi:hypothetical protein ACGGZK_16685 [Agromyces sp. MMS24-K17]|uniref:hypothetical protein n=1 Tax=Agromyces sp. MMS24-K17 TaxID=3372850 RepID=UPI0037551AEA
MRRVAHAIHVAWTRNDLLLYAFTAIATFAVTWFALDLGAARLDVPFEYSGDALAVGAHVKTTLETGWYEFQSLLGAPFGQTYNDFPQADNLHLMVVKVIGLFTNDWAVALNVYYIVGFLLVALAAIWFFRLLGIGRLLSSALSIAFAIAPYHFMRGEGHLWLASYYGVPLGIGLLVLLLQRRPLWGRGSARNPVVAWILSPATRTILFVAILVTSGSYYGIFFLVLLAVTGIAVLIRDRDWRSFWGAVAAGVVAVGVLLANMLPDLVYGWVNGPNPGGLERNPVESEIYALKLTQLLMPWPGHRIPFLHTARAAYDDHYPLLSERPALGALGALGLTVGFLVLAYLAFAWRDMQRRTAPAKQLIERVGWLSGLMFTAFLLSTVGGLSTVISFATSALRGWNRMSIVIALLALGIVGLLLDALLRKLGRRWSWGTVRRAIASAVAAALLVGVAFVDQTPADLTASRAAAAEAFAADAAWIDDVDDQLEPGAMVLQLPYVPFPESASATGVLGSEELVPYLHSTDIRWSGAGIKGRPRSDYPRALEQFPGDDVAVLAATAGFDGIMVDRRAAVEPTDELEEGISAATGEAPLESPNERYAFFSVAGLKSSIESSTTADERARVTELVTDPVTVYPSEGFTVGTAEDGYPQYTTVLPEAELRLVNPSDGDVAATIVFTAVSDEEARSEAHVLGLTVPVSSSPEPGTAQTSFHLTVPAGTHELGIENGTGGRLVIENPRVVPDEVTSYLDRVAGVR